MTSAYVTKSPNQFSHKKTYSSQSKFLNWCSQSSYLDGNTAYLRDWIDSLGLSSLIEKISLDSDIIEGFKDG